MTKKKKPSLLLPVGAAVLLVGGGATAYWFLNQRGGPGELPIGAEVIPQDALMTLSVSTDPGQWQQLREFGTPQSQAAFDKNLAQLRDRLLTANGYDYAKDIQPWIGKEASIALLSPQPLAAAPNTPAPAAPKPLAIVVLPIQNPLQAKQLLEQPRPQAGKLVDRTYKGFQIKETQGKAENISATVFDGRLLVVTTDPKAMDRAIDTYKGEQGQAALKATPGYAQAVSKIQTAQTFGKLYLNFPAATAFTAANTGKAAPPNLAQTQTQGVAATLSLETEGVQFKGVTWYKPDSQKTFQVENKGKSMPGRLPASTLLMASGGNLRQFWQNYSQGATAINLAVPASPDWLPNALKSTVNLDLEQDFLTWMQGEFSLALVATPDGSPAGLPFNLLFMVQSNDRRATEATFKQLDQTMAEKYKFKVEAAKAGDQPLTNWSLPALGFTASHGWLTDNVAFIALGSPTVSVVNEILPKPSASLADSQAFKTSVPSGPTPNNGNFFVNVDAYKAKNLPLPQLPLGNQNLLDAIRSIGVTAGISDARTTRYDVTVLLQKAGKPAPLPSPTVPANTPSPTNSPALELPGAVPSP